MIWLLLCFTMSLFILLFRCSSFVGHVENFILGSDPQRRTFKEIGYQAVTLKNPRGGSHCNGKCVEEDIWIVKSYRNITHAQILQYSCNATSKLIYMKKYWQLFLDEQNFNPIQNGKKTPYQFYPVTSTNVGITPPPPSPLKFRTFSFNPFDTLL